MKSFELKIIS